MNRVRYSLFIVALLLALVLSAFNVAPAFADEVTPPAETQEETQETETTVPEQEAPQDAGETDSASESDSPSVAEVIESLPENTELIVVDENGEALPLASEAAAGVIHNGDPLWCPAGVAPNPGIGGCSPSFTSFNDDGGADTGLIAWLLANQSSVAKAGVIWVESNYAPIGGEGAPIVINGTNFASPGASMDDFALTINGGWAGCVPSCVSTLNPNSPSEFNVPFSIINWTGAITINNIVIEGASGTTPTLHVITNGNITLNNVDVQGNATNNVGASLDNSAGTGTVIVNDSTFNSNTGTNASGLVIYSNSTVTLKNVTANGNTSFGAVIDNSFAATPKAVTLNGTNHFNYNGLDGLSIETKGVVTLNNITAMGNINGHGVYVDNCDYDYTSTNCLFGVANGVTIKGTNNFSDNGWDGLRVWSGGAITVSNITANGNGTSATRDDATAAPDNFDAAGKGAFLHNFGSLTPKAITLTGTNTFNNNASNGLHVDSWGKVTVSNLTASGNGCDLVFEINNDFCAGAYLSAQGGVTQTGYGRFESNSQVGLFVQSINKGVVLLNNLYADNNINGTGVVIIGAGTPPMNVTLNGTNTFTDNGNVGLVIDTDGIITVSNLTASDNVNEGAVLINATALTPKAILIKGPAIFNDNGAFGLVMLSNGAVTTSGITAISNGGNGAIIDNCLYNLGTCATTTAQAVTLNGNNFFEGNNNLTAGFAGLSIDSRGAITINNLTSSYNWDDTIGAFLNNQFDNAVAGITLKGFVTTSFNDSNGLDILTNGAITIANITATGNGDGIDGYGVYLSNDTNSAKPMNVTITGTNQTSNNSDDGLTILTYGAVLINNLTANYNGNTAADDGLRIDNGSGTLARPVTLLGTNMFNGNLGYGLDIYSLGAITINNVMANNNGQDGAYLDNNNLPAISQPVTIKGYGIFNNNANLNGLYIETNGNVMLANLEANNNGAFGAYIYAVNNVAITAFANVTITGVNTFNDNDTGLQIFTDGVITLSNITANKNDAMGVSLDNFNFANSGATGIKNISITGVNMFNNNVSNGLYILSKGTVTLTRITANYNNDLGVGTANGVIVQTEGAINLTCGSMYNNEGAGYNLTSNTGKVITIKGVFTYNNPSNNSASPAAVITRTCPLP